MDTPFVSEGVEKAARKLKASKIALRFPAKAAETACFQFSFRPLGPNTRLFRKPYGIHA
jgi:hypothetical protein